MELNIEKKDDGLLYLRPQQRIDLLQGDQRWEAAEQQILAADPGRGAIIDLGSVDFITSGGFSWLLVQHRRLKEAGRRLVLTNVSTSMLQAIKIMNLDKVFTIVQNEMEAMQLFKAA